MKVKFYEIVFCMERELLKEELNAEKPPHPKRDINSSQELTQRCLIASTLNQLRMIKHVREQSIKAV